MKGIFLFILYPYLVSADFRRGVYPSLGYKTTNSIDDYLSKIIPDDSNTIMKSWLDTERMVRKASKNLIRSMLPDAYKLFTTSGITTECAKDMVNFLKGISETKQWAFQMLDALGKFPSGVVVGTVSSLGDYESCLNVSASNLFIGKYCIVDIKIPLPEKRDFHQWKQDLNLNNRNSIANEFLSWEERLYMLRPRTSICIPSTCTTDDADKLANTALQLTGFEFNSSVKSCETIQDTKEMTSLDILLMTLLFSVVFIVIIASTVDFFQRSFSDTSQREKKNMNLLLSFSFFINMERLVQPDDQADSIRVFHGIRVITMAWLILFHVTLVEHSEFYGGLKGYFELLETFIAQFISSGIVGVETFFFISSTLVAYNIVKNADMKMSVGLVLARRYVRMTISLVLVIAITCLLPFLSSGPLYREVIGKEAQNCKERGWMNLLYINNFLPFFDMCMGNTWYLAADMQLYLIGIITIIPLRKNPRAAIVCIIALLFCGELGILISHIVHHLPPTVLTIDVDSEYIQDNLTKSYLLTHFHLPTYCVGLIVGIFLALKKSFQVSPKVNIVLWIASLSTMCSIVFETYIWNKEREYPGMLTSIIFGCTYRILWSLSLAWITIACQSNHGGIIAKFLGSERFVMLSRLTFMAYLTNFTMKYIYIGTASDVLIYSLVAFLNMYFSILIATFFSALLLSLFFESPFMTLDKALTAKISKRIQGKTINELKHT